MQSGTFLSQITPPPSDLSVINQIRAKIGRKPITNPSDDDDGLIIFQQLSLWVQQLLLKAPWTFATKYYFCDTPLTTNLEANPLVSPQYMNNFPLPADYGRFYRWAYLNSPTYGLVYQIIDNVIQCNISNVVFYYIVNNVQIQFVRPAFQEALIYYGAASVCLQLTNNQPLTAFLWKEYESRITSAIQQNSYEILITQIPYNDFDRKTFI